MLRLVPLRGMDMDFEHRARGVGMGQERGCVAWVWIITGLCPAGDAVTMVEGEVLETVESIDG